MDGRKPVAFLQIPHRYVALNPVDDLLVYRNPRMKLYFKTIHNYTFSFYLFTILLLG